MDIAERVLRLRKEMELTQSEFGKLAGVSKGAVSLWEKGSTTPQRDALSNLRDNCGINPDYLIKGNRPKFIYVKGAESMDAAPAIDAQLDQLSLRGLIDLLNKVTARISRLSNDD